MGINYYFKEAYEPCKCCKRDYEALHIGKSSCGWYFSLRIHPEKSIHNLEDWKKLLPLGVIVNEYGDLISIEEMLKIITERYFNRSKEISEEEFLKNSTEMGDNGLLRYVIDGVHCIGHGEGTWDIFVTDFS